MKHIIIVSYDGISSFYTGVGTILKNTITTLIKNKSSLLKQGVKVSLACIYVDRQSNQFCETSFKNSQYITKVTGGNLIELSNDTEGKQGELWRNVPNWVNASCGLVSVLNNVLSASCENIVMLHDTPFLYFEFAKRQLKTEMRNSVKSFYLPHSTGKNHNFQNSIWHKDRIEFESKCFDTISIQPNSKVIATGKKFANHLREEYGLDFTTNDFIPNGLDFEFYALKEQNTDISDIQRFGITVSENSKIIFSYGRCSIAKGFLELTMAWQKLKIKYPNHLLIIQSPNNSHEPDYFDKLKSYEDNQTIIIDDFNPLIWQTILRYSNTDIVCIPSIMDPNPHTPLETKLFQKGMNYRIVASFKDGVSDSFNENECFCVQNPCDIKHFTTIIENAIECDSETAYRMQKSNAESINMFHYEQSLKSFFQLQNIINL